MAGKNLKDITFDKLYVGMPIVKTTFIGPRGLKRGTQAKIVFIDAEAMFVVAKVSNKVFVQLHLSMAYCCDWSFDTSQE